MEVQVRDDGHLDKDGDEWTDLSYIFEVEQAELDGLDSEDDEI